MNVREVIAPCKGSNFKKNFWKKLASPSSTPLQDFQRRDSALTRCEAALHDAKRPYTCRRHLPRGFAALPLQLECILDARDVVRELAVHPQTLLHLAAAVYHRAMVAATHQFADA